MAHNFQLEAILLHCFSGYTQTNTCTLAAVVISGAPHQNLVGTSRWTAVYYRGKRAVDMGSCKSKQILRGLEVRKTGHRGVTELTHTLGYIFKSTDSTAQQHQKHKSYAAVFSSSAAWHIVVEGENCIFERRSGQRCAYMGIVAHLEEETAESGANMH